MGESASQPGGIERLLGPPPAPAQEEDAPGEQCEQATRHNSDSQRQVERRRRRGHQIKARQADQRPSVVGESLETGGEAAGHLLDDARVLVRDHGVGVAVEDGDGEELVAE